MQSGDHDDTSIQSSGVIDPVRTTLRTTPLKPWAPLIGNKERFTQDYLERWFEGLAAKENLPKLAAHAKLYAEVLVEQNDLMTGASLLKCSEKFLHEKVGMANFHIQLMWENIIPLGTSRDKERKRSISPPPKETVNSSSLGNPNREVLKPLDPGQAVPKPPDPDNISFMSGLSAFVKHISDQQAQTTKEMRKPVPKP